MKQRSLKVIGIGAGNPDHVTMQAVKAMAKVSVFFIPTKGDDKAGLHEARREICARFIDGEAYRLVDFEVPERAKDGPYASDVRAWRGAVRAEYERLLSEELTESEVGGFLIWGDPTLYDGTLRILDEIEARGAFHFDTEVIPGISSVSALAAAHHVALNRIGQPLTVTTGRLVAAGEVPATGNVVVMLDAQNAHYAADPALHVHWGAYVGTEDEVLISGPLGEVADEIAEAREAGRAQHGWIMDTYMLSRGEGG